MRCVGVVSPPLPRPRTRKLSASTALLCSNLHPFCRCLTCRHPPTLPVWLLSWCLAPHTRIHSFSSHTHTQGTVSRWWRGRHDRGRFRSARKCVCGGGQLGVRPGWQKACVVERRERETDSPARTGGLTGLGASAQLGASRSLSALQGLRVPLKLLQLEIQLHTDLCSFYLTMLLKSFI